MIEISKSKRSGGKLRSSKVKAVRHIITDNLKNPDPDVVGLGDEISICMIYSEDDKEELSIKLVEKIGKIENEGLMETSIESPVGQSIIGQKVGSIVKCKPIKKEIEIQIMNVKKFQLEMEKDKVKVKKL